MNKKLLLVFCIAALLVVGGLFLFQNKSVEDIQYDNLNNEKRGLGMKNVLGINEEEQNNLRTTDSIDKKDGKTKEYDSNKNLKIKDDKDKTIMDLTLTSRYNEWVSLGEDVKVAEFYLIDYSRENIFDSIKSYSVNEDYEEVEQEYWFKYGLDYTEVECYDEEEETFCEDVEKTNWIEFNLLSELPSKNIKIGLFTDTTSGKKIEWVSNIHGFEILEWASFDPVPVGNYTDGDLLDAITDVFTVGNLSYTVSSNGDALAVFNISTHGNPILVGNVSPSVVGDFSIEGASSVFVLDGYAYVTSDTDDRLVVFNVSVVGDPVPVGFYPSGLLNTAEDVFVLGDLAYVASSNGDSLTVFNISAHSNPVLVGSYNTNTGDFSSNFAQDVFVLDGYAYLASDSSRLVVFNVSVVGDPVPVGFYRDSSGAGSINGIKSVFVLGDFAYTASSTESSFAIFNISAHGNPVLTGYVDNFAEIGVASGVHVVGDSAYVCGDGKFSVYNVSIKNSPQNIGFYSQSSGAFSIDGCRNLYVSDNFAYVTAFTDDNLVVFNLSEVPPIPLTINITYPINNTNYSTPPPTLNWTLGGEQEEFCWYSDNAGVDNVTVTCSDLQTSISPGQGTTRYDMWTNDSSNNQVSDNVTFFVDSIAPVLDITYPTESFLWYGWDTDGNNTILVDLNWTTFDINSLDKCWYTNNDSENVTVTCGDNATTLISYSSVDWYVWGNDTLGNLGSDTQTTEYGALINNSHTANTSTFETKTEIFSVNLTYPSSEFTISAVLNYSGTEYAATKTGSGDTAIFTRTLDIPTVSSTSNQSYYFNITLNNGTNLFYQTDERNITVNKIFFTECNATYPVAFLNYTFKDEEQDTFLDASVPTSTFEYWLGDGNQKKEYFFNDAVDTASYAFCFSTNETLHMDLEFQFKQDPGFPVRTENFIGDLTNDTTFTILFLAGTDNGQYITFQIQELTSIPLPGALVQMERQIGGAWTNIGSLISDDAGQAIFYLDTTLNHRLTVSHDDFQTQILTIRPSNIIYTIMMGQISTEEPDYTRGISKVVYPNQDFLDNATKYDFNFTLTSTFWTVTEFGFTLTYENGTIIATTSSSDNGGTLSANDINVTFFLTNESHIDMDYYYIINSTEINRSRTWEIVSTEGRQFSLWRFFTTLSLYINSGNLFGFDNFGRILLSVIVLIMVAGGVSLRYGIRSDTFTMGVIFGIVLLLDYGLNFFPQIKIGSNFAINNFATFIVAIILIAVLIKEER